MTYLKFLFLSFTFIISSCKEKSTKNSIKGIWKSIGYGKILKININSYEYYDITDISCLSSKEGNISEVKNSMQISNDTLTVKRGFNKYRYVRINKFPDLCKKTIKDKNDIPYNFEVFANTYKNHYAYFKLNKIDWNNLYKKSREKINSKTTDVELYLIIQEMIEILKEVQLKCFVACIGDFDFSPLCSQQTNYKYKPYNRRT